MPSCSKYISYILSKGLPSSKDSNLIEAIFRYVSESLRERDVVTKSVLKNTRTTSFSSGIQVV